MPKNICKAAVITAEQQDAGRAEGLEPDVFITSSFAPDWLYLRAPPFPRMALSMSKARC